MKTVFQALGMAVILVLYGYFLSMAGHDHSAHEHTESHSTGEQENHPKDGHEHDHSRH